MTKTDILRRYAFYREAQESLQKKFAHSATAITLHRGDFYFHEGDSCSQVALLGSGSVRVYKSGESGREITLYHVREGETCILTASCVLAGMRYPAAAIAELPTDAVVFPSVVFRELITEHETVREFVFQSLASRMTDLMTLIEEITFNKMDKRLADNLLLAFHNGGRPINVIHATHEQIAAELGSAREVVSRLLKEFERLGAIEVARGRILLRNEQLLRHGQL
jgi:CRP/FNR family transcriptional regulator